MVVTFLSQQLKVVTLLHDLAIVDDKNRVGMDDGRQSMGNDKSGTSSTKYFQTGLDRGLGITVDTAGRFVQEQNLGVFEDGSRDGHALELATRELYTPFTNLLAITFGESHDLVVKRNGFAGVSHFIFGSVEFGVSQILQDRLVEQNRVLWYDTHVCTKTVHGHGTYVLVIYQDSTFSNIVEAEE